MTVSDRVFTSIEKELTETHALYRWTENIPETYLSPEASRIWSKEDVFSKEPIRRFALTLISSWANLGSKLTISFLYREHGWTRLQITAIDTQMQALICNQMMKSEFISHFWILFLLVVTDMIIFLPLIRMILCLLFTLQLHNKHLMIFSILKMPMQLCPWSWHSRQHYQQILQCFYQAKKLEQFLLTPTEKCRKTSFGIQE